MKALSNCDKLKVFIAPKMTDLITFLDNNRKLAIYTWVNIYGIYCNLEIIGYPNTLNISGQRSHNFGLPSSKNIDTSNIQLVISALRVCQKIICK